MAAMDESYRPPSEDPLHFVSRVATKLNTIWRATTYPFASFGKKVSIHYSCDLRRSIANSVSLGDHVFLAPDVWLNTADDSKTAEPKIVLRSGCRIGRRSSISAKNQIILEPTALSALVEKPLASCLENNTKIHLMNLK